MSDSSTSLVSLSVPGLTSAHRVIGTKTKEGGFPLVLLPGRAPTWWLKVPEGFFALLYKGGEKVGIVKPGFHLLSPLYRVQYLVSKQWTVFDTPVKQCATKDNVKVAIDCILVFRIFDAEKFVVLSSPSGLEGLLKDKVQEGVRYLARQQRVEEIYSLSGAGQGTEDMKRDFNETFNRYGVEVSQVTITHVAIPPQQAKNLEEISWYSTREEDQRVTTEYSMLMAKLEKEKKENKVKLQHTQTQQSEQLEVRRISAETEVGQISQATAAQGKEHDAETAAAVEEINARSAKLVADRENERNMRVAEVTSTAENRAAQIRAEADSRAAQILKEAEVETRLLLEAAEQKAAQMRLDAEQKRREDLARAHLTAAELEAKGLALRAEAEEATRTQVAGRREYELRLKQLDVLETMAGNESLVVSGSKGLLCRDQSVPYEGPEYKYEARMVQQKAELLEQVVKAIGHRAVAPVK